MNSDGELVPRNYQEALIRICVKQNSIIFLPTGSGKTFIAVCALKQLVKDDFSRSYSEGGKICVFIVDSVALVTQHGKYISNNTPYSVGTYTGDMNLDNWDKSHWLNEYNTHNVIIMTAQILRNSLTSNLIDLNKVNVLIFDECHHGVENHPMREIMFYFSKLNDSPRVIGLTATLLNGNIKPHRVLNEVEKLETTFHSKVATVDALINVVGYSTNPHEELCTYSEGAIHPLLVEACEKLDSLIELIKNFKAPKPKIVDPKISGNLEYLKEEKPFDKYHKLLLDAQIHFRMLGIAGARIACIVYSIHMELEKRNCTNILQLSIVNSIYTCFSEILEKFEPIYQSYPETQRILALSSSKVITLIQILTRYKQRTSKNLCAIVFVERRNTAIFLYHMLNDLVKTYETLNFIKPDFIIRSTANPLNGTTEALYYAKLNKKIMDKFTSNEANLLFASNVIEEGIDIPMCTLVVKFDPITNYRSYIQSKGRARHSDSLYYIMVEDVVRSNFHTKYQMFQSIENNLNQYLVGNNEIRTQPRDEDIERMYAETTVFYVDGPGSANITEKAAFSLLNMYCSAAKADMYTQYEPVCYLEVNHIGKFKVHIELPNFCPIKDLICGEWRVTKKDAKRSAAFHACIVLFKIGELTEEMIPRTNAVNYDDEKYLFKHWPENRDKTDGLSKTKRSYNMLVPYCLSVPIEAGHKVYLHIIDLNAQFSSDHTIMQNIYASNLCFGIVSACEFPNICQFSTYVTLGDISVKLHENQGSLILTKEQLYDIKRFHHLVFDDILGITSEKSYLMLGTNQTQFCYLVPVLKSTNSIDFDTMQTRKKIIDFYSELTNEEKVKLLVNNETYFQKIITPYYRNDRKHHLVMAVCEDLNALSPFPNTEHATYADYYETKYQRLIVNPRASLLLVKPLSSNLNCLKPKGIATKRKRDEAYETMEQRFIPELCIKQEFPSSLWVMASLLPSILYRIDYLLRAEELRSKIVREAKLGHQKVDEWQPLKLDMRLIKYKIDINENHTNESNSMNEHPTEMKAEDIGKFLIGKSINQTFKEIMTDNQYPWHPAEEPVDLWKTLQVTSFDIDSYWKFIKTDYQDSKKCKNIETGNLLTRGIDYLAINYEVDYKYKPIKILQPKTNSKGPELSAIYEVLSAAKAQEVVNLERMETLGDSFLKLVASLYIFIKFPTYSEGPATNLKGRLISNRNLYYLARLHKLGGFLKVTELKPKDEWLPPGYCIPVEVCTMIENKEMPIDRLFNIEMSKKEQLLGVLEQNTLDIIKREKYIIDESEELDSAYSSMCHYLGIQIIGDKTLADVVEALIGVYIDSMGISGGLKIMEWLGILPENLYNDLFLSPTANPIVATNYSASDIYIHLSNYEATQIEKVLDYKFKNRAFLLQALTHASFNSNRLTDSYQRLEFIGDAVLDVLITFFIFENNSNLDPGQLTDLRSALVNNETFAAYVVKLGLHKYLKHYSVKLTSLITKFDNYQTMNNHQITVDVLTLLDEDNVHLAENVDVPKVLGDLFESLAGAIFLDSGKDLNCVWRVFYKIMWREIQAFSNDIPKNPIRMLYETLAPLKPSFKEAVPIDTSNSVMVSLDFVLNGVLTRVHGFGDNSSNAKKAASKIALRLLNAKTK